MGMELSPARNHRMVWVGSVAVAGCCHKPLTPEWVKLGKLVGLPAGVAGCGSGGRKCARVRRAVVIFPFVLHKVFIGLLCSTVSSGLSKHSAPLGLDGRVGELGAS